MISEGRAPRERLEEDPKEKAIQDVVTAVNSPYERINAEHLKTIQWFQQRIQDNDTVIADESAPNHVRVAGRTENNNLKIEQQGYIRQVQTDRVSMALNEQIIRQTVGEAEAQDIESILMQAYDQLSKLMETGSDVESLFTEPASEMLPNRLIKNLAVWGNAHRQSGEVSISPVSALFVGAREYGTSTSHFAPEKRSITQDKRLSLLNQMNGELRAEAIQSGMGNDEFLLNTSLAAQAVERGILSGRSDTNDNRYNPAGTNGSYCTQLEQHGWTFSETRDGALFAVAPKQQSSDALNEFTKILDQYRSAAEQPVEGITEVPTILLSREDMITKVESGAKEIAQLRSHIETMQNALTQEKAKSKAAESAVEQLRGSIGEQQSRIQSTGADAFKQQQERGRLEREVAETRRERDAYKQRLDQVGAELKTIVSQGGMLGAGIIQKIRGVLTKFTLEK